MPSFEDAEAVRDFVYRVVYANQEQPQEKPMDFYNKQFIDEMKDYNVLTAEDVYLYASTGVVHRQVNSAAYEIGNWHRSAKILMDERRLDIDVVSSLKEFLNLDADDFLRMSQGTHPVHPFLIAYSISAAGRGSRPLLITDGPAARTTLTRSELMEEAPALWSKLSAKLRGFCSDGGWTLFGNSAFGQNTVPDYILNEMLSGARSISLKAIYRLYPFDTQLHLPETRSYATILFLGNGITPEDFGGTLHRRYRNRVMLVTVSGKRYHVDCNLLGSSGPSPDNVICRNGGNPIPVEIENKVYRIAAINYIKQIVDEAYNTMQNHSSEMTSELIDWGEKLSVEQAKDEIQRAKTMQDSAWLVIEAIRNGVKPGGLGGKELNGNVINAPAMGVVLEKVIPLLEEKRGAFYSGLVEELRTNARQCDVPLSNTR